METLAKSLSDRCFKYKLQGYLYVKRVKIRREISLEVNGDILLSLSGPKGETQFSWTRDSRVYSGENFLEKWGEVSDLGWREIKMEFLQKLIDELF